MSNYIFLLVACIFAIEVIIKSNLKLNIRSIMDIYSKIISVISSAEISDHWKEKAIIKYARILLKKSLILLSSLLLIIFIIMILNMFSPNFLNITLSLKGIILSIIFSFSYLKLRSILFK